MSERWKFVLSEIITFSLFPCVCYTDTSAKLTLKKAPTEDKTFILPIHVKDNAGVGIIQSFEGEPDAVYSRLFKNTLKTHE